MFSALRFRSISFLSPSLHPPICPQSKQGFFLKFYGRTSKIREARDIKKSVGVVNPGNIDTKYLSLQEIQKVLSEVKADDVKVIPVKGLCEWTDFMVLATGRSVWHVRNIAEALVYETKQKQIEAGTNRLLMPTISGQRWGNWIVVDSGRIVVHALEEDARERFALDQLYTEERSMDSEADVRKIFEYMFVPFRKRKNLKYSPASAPDEEDI